MRAMQPAPFPSPIAGPAGRASLLGGRLAAGPLSLLLLGAATVAGVPAAGAAGASTGPGHCYGAGRPLHTAQHWDQPGLLPGSGLLRRCWVVPCGDQHSHSHPVRRSGRGLLQRQLVIGPHAHPERVGQRARPQLGVHSGVVRARRAPAWPRGPSSTPQATRSRSSTPWPAGSGPSRSRRSPPARGSGTKQTSLRAVACVGSGTCTAVGHYTVTGHAFGSFWRSG